MSQVHPDLARIYNVFGLSSNHSLSTLLANVEGLKRSHDEDSPLADRYRFLREPKASAPETLPEEQWIVVAMAGHEDVLSGAELDKDILGDGTHYSPATCCFVPKSVNVFWTNCTSKTGVLIGANFAKDRGNWVARCTIGNRKKTLGVFRSELEAHQAWIRAKSQALADLLAPLGLDERIVTAMYDKLRTFELQAAQLKATA